MSEKKQAYGQILKSSSIVGGAQVINLLIGMVRVKFVAVLLGPTGIGLQGMFMTIRGLSLTLSGLGINSSGVRDVAEAAGSKDLECIARTVLTLRRMCWLTGGIGMLLLVTFSQPISYLSFGTSAYTIHIAILGLGVLIGSISAGQMALIQGMRRIGDLAKLNVITALVGTFIAVGLFWWLGMDGIIPSLLSLSVVSLLGSWWFARRIQIVKISMTWRETFATAKDLVGLGLAFMWTGLLAAVLAYFTRLLITQQIDLAAVGVYTAAFALSGMFLNFVLSAMGADFYPRLTAISNDHAKMKELVNQQTEIGLLLAVPGLLATLAFAPWVVSLFYTSEFLQAGDLLQWFVLGCFGKVISWPMGFILLAKSKGRLFAVSETLTSLTHLSYIWLGLKYVGIEGVAIAFCFLYMTYIFWMMFISRRLIDFEWSPSVVRLLIIFLPVVIFTILQSRCLSLWSSTVIGLLITLVTGLYCVREACFRLGYDSRITCLVNKIPLSKYLLQK